jgi:hypothetical protein
MTTAREPPLPRVCVQLRVLAAAAVLAAWLTASSVMVAATKVAVTLLVALTVRLCGFVAPVRSPLKPVKKAPELGVAVNCTRVPGA